MNSDGKAGLPDRSTQFFANERTFLAWIRTSIAIIGLGFVVARFSLFLREFALVAKPASATVDGQSPSSVLGMAMVALGVILAAYALYNYKKAHAVIESGQQYVSKHVIMNLATVGLIAFGVIVIAYLLVISI